MSSPCPFFRAKSPGMCVACGPYVPSVVEKENYCRTTDYPACVIYDLRLSGCIGVMFQNGTFGTVENSILDELIEEAEIIKFRRMDGWVTIGCSPIRLKKGIFGGPDKRRL